VSNERSMNYMEKVLAVLVTVMLVLMIVQVISRYIFGKPLSFTEEAARLVFIWVVFLGAAEAFRRKTTISIDVLFKILPRKVQKAIEGLNSVVIAGVLAMLILSGIKVVKATSHVDLITVPLPASFVYLAVPVACAIMLIYAFWNLVGWVKRKKKEEMS
jgi:TRAP-type transport system small permease protein